MSVNGVVPLTLRCRAQQSTVDRPSLFKQNKGESFGAKVSGVAGRGIAIVNYRLSMRIIEVPII